ncbi:MAG: ABC transporter permease [Candidatus Caenarcaniphilales bacterium]|jgi:phospholipid/cholesterol/gamma-HCH transport system permease protein|nr:ABC transporter permease [Candidatus Caenarcaniphilales bacterium]
MNQDINQAASAAHKASILEIIGSAVLNLESSSKYITSNKIQPFQFVKYLVFLGYESLPMILILTGIATMILTLNTSIELSHQGGRELIGALICVANLREIVPIFTSFALAARCGTALTAEISTMKVTEQIDVLKVFKISPNYFLTTPVIWATALLIPFIVAMVIITSVISGMIVAKLTVQLEFTEFLDSAWKMLTLKEYFYPVLKTEIFTIFSMLINITMGFNCKGGAREVGLTTTRATSIVIVGIVILDGLLTPVLYM